ncbi:MAG: hypothetical protein VX654_03630, partial [Chloroflexota bacterium]|nr:hypothetical protein [Chloroflexota bacterium]
TAESSIIHRVRGEEAGFQPALPLANRTSTGAALFVGLQVFPCRVRRFDNHSGIVRGQVRNLPLRGFAIVYWKISSRRLLSADSMMAPFLFRPGTTDDLNR